MKMRIKATSLMLGLTIVSASQPVHAQWQPGPTVWALQAPPVSAFTSSPAATSSPILAPVELQGMPVPLSGGTRTALRLAGWGTLGSVAGFVGGGLLAGSMACRIGCAGEHPGLDQGLIGAVAGAAVLTPFTVHVANERRGSLPAAYAAAALITAVGIAGMYEAGNPAFVIFLFGAPLAQLVSAVWIESVTGRSPE